MHNYRVYRVATNAFEIVPSDPNWSPISLVFADDLSVQEVKGGDVPMPIVNYTREIVRKIQDLKDLGVWPGVCELLSMEKGEIKF